jgi:apolipoprotein D and lipocalin family protein
MRWLRSGAGLPALLVCLTLASCAGTWRDTEVPMRSVAEIDLARYAGRWYEVARFPVVFQQGCTATTADYALLADGSLSVVNSCRQGSPEGPVNRISGTATATGPGQLSVRLGRIPFAGPYWVLWVAEDYRTAVVGVPSGRAGWVLHRSPDIPPERLERARAVLAANGYDTDRLMMTVH